MTLIQFSGESTSTSEGWYPFQGDSSSDRCTKLYSISTQFIVMTARYAIPYFGDRQELDGTNYPLWKMKVRSNLVLWESWEIVRGIEVMPQSTISPATTGTSMAAIVPANLKLVRAWRKLDAEALAIIIGTKANVVLPHIHVANSSFEAWKTLRDMYELNNDVSILGLEIEL